MGWGNMFSSESSYTETNTIQSAVNNSTIGAGATVLEAAAIKGGVNTVGYSSSTTNIVENITSPVAQSAPTQSADPFTSPIASSILSGATGSSSAPPSVKAWYANAGLWLVVAGAVVAYFYWRKE